MNTARQLLLDNDSGSDRIKFDFNFSYENDFKPTFTCRRCGKAEYRNGEFETIKLGDIFTHITHFPSGASPGDDNICTQCVDVNDNSKDVKPFLADVKSVTATHKSLQNNYNNNNNNNNTTDNYNNKNNHHSSNNIMLSNPNNTNTQSPQSTPQDHHDGMLCTTNSNNGFQQQQSNPGNSTITVAVLPSPYGGDVQKASTITVGNNLDGSSSQYMNHHHHHHHTLTEQPKYTINVVNPLLETSQSPGDSLTTYVVSHLQEAQGNQQETSSIAPSISSPSSSTSLLSSSSSSSVPTLQGAGISLTSSTTIVTPAATTSTGTSDGTATNGTSSGTTATNGNPNSKECQICKKVFKSNKIAQLHFQRVHEKIGRYCCHVCGIRFSYRGSLDSHLASHTTPEITHNCPTCGQKFKEKSNLTNHMKIHSDNPKKFMCEYCPSGFSKRVNLRYHIKRKHPEEVANCSLFNNTPGVSGNNNTSSSAQSDSVSSSTQQQSSVPNSNNNTNGNNMNQSYQPGVNTGMGATSTGKSPNNKDKPQGNFKCEHCGRMFLFKNNLKAHLRTHTRDKKYTCEICEKSFIYKESLKNHMLLHSNELPYLCDICGKKFRDRSNRRKHVKNVHKYLFTNGDGTPSAGPGNSTNDKNFKIPSVPESNQQQLQQQSGDPNSTSNKKKRNTKKNQIGLDPNNDPEKRGIIKSTNNNKKRGGSNTATSTSPPPNLMTNNKSVIVSMAGGMNAGALGAVDQDRKIIMSPSPKNMGSPLEYTRLPVTVHVPASSAGSLHQHYVSTTNRNQNVIVKASSASPSADMDLYHRNQNVIVYPKSKGNANVIPDYAQAQPSSVISQTNIMTAHQQQPQQQSHIPQQPQYYTEDPAAYDRGAVPPTYMTIPMATITSPGQESGQNPTMIYEFAPAPPQVQSIKVEPENPADQQQSQQTSIRYDEPVPENSEQVQYPAPVYATSTGSDGSIGGYHLHHPDPQQQPQQQPQQHQYWTLAPAPPTDVNNQNQVPIPSDGPPYSTPSSVSAPAVSYESPITAASNVLNAPSYAQADIADPANSNYYYKDLSQFDFSYL